MANKTKTEKDWQAQEDAYTMARYEEIMQDASRKKAAIAEAKKQAADMNKRAAAMNKVASSKSKTTSSRSKKK